jgi:ligand-binding sensor domain-containing protein
VRFSKFFILLSEFIVLTLITFSSAGQNLFVKSFDIRSESTRPRILKILSDHNGLIWVGTDNGVFTFDGVSFKIVPGTDSLIDKVTALYEDKSNRIWIGMETGKIILIKNLMVSSLPFEQIDPRVEISSFTDDIEGRIYFATKGEGIFYVEGTKIHSLNTSDGLSNNYCYAMVTLPDQRICVGTDAGINFISFPNGKRKISVIGTSEGLLDDIARTFAFGKENILWIGLQDKGFAKYDYAKNKLLPVQLKSKWNFGQVNCLLPMNKKLWVATEENGILVVDENGNTNRLNLEHEQDIKANDMLEDFENNVWISESIHLYRTSGDKMSLIEKIDNQSLHFIHCITNDKNGNIWFSPDTQIGCFSKDNQGTLKYKIFKVLDRNIDIVTLYFDPYGFLWFGTMGKGVFRFNPATGHVRKIVTHTDFEESSVLSISGKGDVIWVTGFNSVMRFNIRENGGSDNATIESGNFFTDEKLLNDYVYSVFIDSKDRVWFGTDANGVFMYDGKNLVNSLVLNKAVHSFAEDHKGRIWFSIADEGLKYIDINNSVYSFQTIDGLSDPSPTSLLCANNGKIIIVHSNGFDVLDPDTKEIYYHSAEENLSDLNPDLNSITSTSDGTIWMGTEKGVLNYVPDFDTHHYKPSIVLRSVSVFLDRIDFQSKNIFSAGENNLRFDFDGLWYSDPQKINYQFMLEGYSPKWESTKDHTVIFPKLPPGKYTFRIKPSLNSVFNNSNEASYSFIINPYFWQRWWFRLLVAGFIAVFVVLVIRRRERRIRKFDRLQKEKIQFQFETLRSQVNPHFLFNSFNTLISFIENSPSLAVEYVEKLSEFFRNIVNYRDKNLITLEEEIHLLGNYIFIQKKRYGENLELEILLDEKTKKSKYVPPLTLQLLAENAIKHNAVSKESKLRITIGCKDGKMEISNNINPKMSKETSSGMGLQNIINRYELLTKEEIGISSEDNRFSITVPLLNSSNENINS